MALTTLHPHVVQYLLAYRDECHCVSSMELPSSVGDLTTRREK